MNMLKILAAKNCEDFPTCSGSRYREDFVGVLDKNTGVISLASVGKTDVYEYIQSFAEETDINTLIKRAENGDLSAFSSAVFGDFSEMPETYADALNIVIEAEREFNHLPANIKDRFNNDFHQYIVTAGSREWIKKFDPDFVDRPDQHVSDSVNEKEVTNNEPKQ